jgi:hypothetical protein
MTYEKKPWFCVECKVRADVANPSLSYFGERLGIPHLFQIHLEGKDDFLDGKVRVMLAGKFLAALP